MAIVNTLNSTAINFADGSIAHAKSVNAAFNDLLQDITNINEAGVSYESATEEISSEVTALNTVNLPSFEVPRLVNIEFYLHTSDRSLCWDKLDDTPNIYIYWRDRTFTVNSQTGTGIGGDSEEFVYYDFDPASVDGDTITLQRTTSLPAVLSGEFGNSLRRYFFAIKSGQTGAWNLSVTEAAEILHAGMVSAGILSADRIDAASLAISKLDSGATARMFSSSDNATNIESWVTDTTYIDGGKVKTDTIKADSIDVNDLFAQNIMINDTGRISNETDVSDEARVYNDAKAGFYLGYSTVPTTNGFVFEVKDANGDGLSYDPDNGFKVTLQDQSLTYHSVWDAEEDDYNGSIGPAIDLDDGSRYAGLIHFLTDPDTDPTSVEVSAYYAITKDAVATKSWAYNVGLKTFHELDGKIGADGDFTDFTTDTPTRDFGFSTWSQSVPIGSNHVSVQLNLVWRSEAGIYSDEDFFPVDTYENHLGVGVAFTSLDGSDITIDITDGVNTWDRFSNHSFIYVRDHDSPSGVNSGYYQITGGNMTDEMVCTKIGTNFNLSQGTATSPHPAEVGGRTISVYSAIGFLPYFTAIDGEGSDGASKVIGHLEIRRTRE